MTKDEFIVAMRALDDEGGLETVDHPAHYRYDTIEAIDIIEAWALNFNRGNVLKYLSRAGLKSPDSELEDLHKALWYLKREIMRLRNENTENDTD